MKTLKNFRNIILLCLIVLAASCSKKSDNNKVEPLVEAEPPDLSTMVDLAFSVNDGLCYYLSSLKRI